MGSRCTAWARVDSVFWMGPWTRLLSARTQGRADGALGSGTPAWAVACVDSCLCAPNRVFDLHLRPFPRTCLVSFRAHRRQRMILNFVRSRMPRTPRYTHLMNACARDCVIAGKAVIETGVGSSEARKGQAFVPDGQGLRLSIAWLSCYRSAAARVRRRLSWAVCGCCLLCASANVPAVATISGREWRSVSRSGAGWSGGTVRDGWDQTE